MSLTDEELNRFLRNEEKLWDMAAITISSALIGAGHFPDHDGEFLAEQAYDLADALVAERRKRLQIQKS